MSETKLRPEPEKESPEFEAKEEPVPIKNKEDLENRLEKFKKQGLEMDELVGESKVLLELFEEEVMDRLEEQRESENKRTEKNERRRGAYLTAQDLAKGRLREEFEKLGETREEVKEKQKILKNAYQVLDNQLANVISFSPNIREHYDKKVKPRESTDEGKAMNIKQRLAGAYQGMGEFLVENWDELIGK